MCEPLRSVLHSIAPLVSTTFLARMPQVHFFGYDSAHHYHTITRSLVIHVLHALL